MGGIATQMREVLEKLLKRTPDIQVAAVVSAEGLMMMSAPDYEDEELLAALASSMMFQGERVVKDLGKGNLEQVLVKGKDGYVVAQNIGEDAALVVLTHPGGKLGLLFLELKHTVRELESVLKAGMEMLEESGSSVSGGGEETVPSLDLEGELGGEAAGASDVTTLEDLEKEGEDFFGT